jgi:hypothetical protein
MIISNDLWDQTSLGSHTSTPCEVEMNLTGSSTPPPFQFSSSSLSTALTNPDLPRISPPFRDVPVPRSDPAVSPIDCCITEQSCPQILGSSSMPETSIRITDEPAPNRIDNTSSHGDNTPYVTTDENTLDPVFQAPIPTPPPGPNVNDSDIQSATALQLTLVPPGKPSIPAAEVSNKSIRSKKRSKYPTHPRLSSCLPVDSE